jgi:hypothetical protein
VAAFGTWRACAALGGVKRASLPELTDPADVLEEPPPARRGAGRAAQVAAFVAATGGDTG